MMRNLKVLGTAVVAVLAMSAFVASAASADTFQSEGGVKASLTGAQVTTNILKTTAGSAECKTATFTATTASGVSEVPAVPAYSSCTCIGIACTVSMNGCSYVLRINGAGSTTGTADVVCPEGKEITLTSAKCIVHVPAQAGLATVTYSNSGATTTREVVLTLNIAGIKYSHTKVGEGIGSCTSGSGTTGTLTGSVKATGVTDGTATHVGIFVA